jgi:pyruvate dehydrogenase E1 component alpha subunit
VAVGQESAAAAIALTLKPGDLLFTNHRNHAHLLARGADPGRVMAEVFGKATGYCRGRAGSWHISAAEVGVPIASAIVAANTALAVGAGLAFQRRKEPSVAVSCLGDRSLNEGIAWEALNLAALWQLPVVFLCENNDAVPYDPTTRSGVATDVLTRPIEAFHVRVSRVDGADFAAVLQSLATAVEHARGGGGPAFIEVLTIGWPGALRAGRYTYETGPTRIASAWEPDPLDSSHREWHTHEPLVPFLRQLLAQGRVTPANLEALDLEARSAVDAAVQFARESPWPERDEALTGTFA